MVYGTHVRDTSTVLNRISNKAPRLCQQMHSPEMKTLTAQLSESRKHSASVHENLYSNTEDQISSSAAVRKLGSSNNANSRLDQARQVSGYEKPLDRQPVNRDAGINTSVNRQGRLRLLRA